MNDAANTHDDWPVNDVRGLAERLPGLDPQAYYDDEAVRAYEAALQRCPALARLLGLAAAQAEAAAGTPWHPPLALR
ncbi:hypothetical protein AWB81_05925 [Caballeronia arationis]|jgi:hypothetical protein|uniref:Uncharacterized protein n=1 Tax=Caballeronia arationis TaxID=1777142 RepID=A0A7Z7I1I5_9BURK|nr:hypothetical protein [Caballeronia arationis]SAL00694.1 hypothetical protein AWB81_05925 [Caballeronia arationis]SOE51439.1 hypothetical protein SAMN05446927_0474 [Caballeronia arationis]